MFVDLNKMFYLKMKLFFIFILMANGLLVFSHENYTKITRKIVVLSSLRNPEVNPFWRSEDYEISLDIEEQFRKYFKNSGYQMVFEHRASALTLEKYLTSADTLALFWISHARERIGLTKEVISDFWGNNIADVFQKIHPDVRFLGIVGCSAKAILEENFKNGYYKNNINLTTHSFFKSIRLNKGIKQSVKASAEILDLDPKNFLTYKTIERDDRKRRVPTRQSILAPMNEIELFHPVISTFDSLEIIVRHILKPSIVTIGQTFIGLLDPTLESQVLKIPKDLFYRGQFKLKLTFLKEDESIVTNMPEKVDVLIEDENYKELIKRQMPNSSSQFIYIIPSR